MSTVLAYTSPAVGHLFPMTPLLLELASRGHDVHVRTLADRVGLMQSLGLRAARIDPAIEAIGPLDWQERSQLAALKSTVRMFAERATHDAADLERAVADVRPDLLVVDTNSWGACSVAEASGLPWAMFCPYIPPVRSRGTPAFGPGLQPWSGPVGRVRDAFVGLVFTGAAERVMLPPLNELRTGLGLARVPSVDAYLRGVPLLLLTTAPPFDYPHDDWPSSIRPLGALPWEPPTDPPAWLDDVEGPLVLVTTSSEYQADEALVRAAVEGLAGEPYTVVATMPAGLSGLSDLGPLPPNVRVVDFVPHGQVLDRAVVAVTHGGMGATQKALARGIPVCVVPFGRDQLETAARVVHADAGTRLSRRSLSPDTLRQQVREAMTKRAGAERVAAGYAAAGGAPAGAAALETLVAAAPATDGTR